MSMYNLVKCSSNYSDMTGSLWFYSRNETAFDTDIAGTNDFTPFKHQAKLLRNTFASGYNAVL